MRFREHLQADASNGSFPTLAHAQNTGSNTVRVTQDPAAREALSVFFRTTRFLPVDPASQQALDDLRRGVTRVREQLE